MSTYKASLNNLDEDINIDISVGNLNVLTSGTLFSSNNQNIDIVIDDIKINFCFQTDTENTKTRMSSEDADEKTIKLILTNFQSSTPEGKFIPIALLYTEKFDIYLTYAISTLNKGKGHRQVTYTIYYGEKQ